MGGGTKVWTEGIAKRSCSEGPARGHPPEGGLFPLRSGYPIHLDILDGLDLAEGDALGISVAIVAFHGHPFHGIEERVPERTSHNAGLTTDALFLVDDNPLIFSLLVAGLGRTDLGAEGFLAVLTAQGKIETDRFPFDHPDPRPARIACPCVKNGADKLALPAARAFLVIDQQDFSAHHLTIIGTELQDLGENDSVRSPSLRKAEIRPNLEKPF